MDKPIPSHTLMRTYLQEVTLGGNLSLIDELALPDVVDEANLAFGGPVGRAGLVQHVKGFRRHITNLKLNIHRIVGNESDVMAWWSFRGVHSGPWLGRPATGEPIDGDVFSFFTLREGRIARYRLWLHANFKEPVVFDSTSALKAYGRAIDPVHEP
ncbi:MAG: ester cyclase [Gammaproteobacteria bacterium]